MSTLVLGTVVKELAWLCASQIGGKERKRKREREREKNHKDEK